MSPSSIVMILISFRLSSCSRCYRPLLTTTWHSSTISSIQPPPPMPYQHPISGFVSHFLHPRLYSYQDFASISSCIASGYIRCSADSRRPTMCVTRQSFPVWLLHILVLSEIETIPSIFFESYFQYSTFTFNTSIDPGDPICSGIPLLQL